MKPKLILKGSVVPLITPLREDEDVDLAAVTRLVEFHKAEGTDGLFLLGTCGEGPSLTDDVKIRFVEAVLRKAGDMPVLVGITEMATKRAAVLANKLKSEMIAGYVLMPPVFQFATTVEEHCLHIKRVQETLEAPLILYNLPRKSAGNEIPLEVVRSMVSAGTAVGIKDSSGNISYLEGLLQIRREFPAFRIMNGELKTAQKALEMGVDGLVMSYANIDPAGCLEIIKAVQSADREKAEVLQKKFLEVWDSFPPEASFIAKVKSILTARGLCQNVCCGPTKPTRPVIPRALS